MTPRHLGRQPGHAHPGAWRPVDDRIIDDEQEEACRRLILSLLSDAVQDHINLRRRLAEYKDNGGNVQKDTHRDYWVAARGSVTAAEAQRWLDEIDTWMHEKEEYLLSWTHCCQVLGVDPGRMREKVLAFNGDLGQLRENILGNQPPRERRRDHVAEEVD